MRSSDPAPLLDECVAFAQRLIRTPSMSRQEAQLANLVVAEMAALGFDEVSTDGMGNVQGRIYGRDRSLDALVLNSHLDHVDPGDVALWPVPPYAGEIVDDRLVGRGACDIKGPLAVQIYGMATLLRQGERPRRDVVFSGVVQEETGGAGARYWVEHLAYPVALVVLSEPSSNKLAIGHRGIVQMWVTFEGRPAHASAPQRADNPNFALARFLNRLAASQQELSAHPLLGPTSVAPTLIEVDTRSPNVTPAWTRVLLDFRTASESSNSLQAFVRRLAGAQPVTITDAWCSEPAPLPDSAAPIFGFYTPPDSEVVQRVQEAIGRGTGRPLDLASYRFATDGRLFVPYGLPVVGYAPGDEEQAHTIGESIAIAQMEEALRGYAGLLRAF